MHRLLRSFPVRVGSWVAVPWLLFSAAPLAHAATDLAIAKTGPGGVQKGQALVYTIVVQNLGASAGDATVEDPTPSGLTFVSNSGGGCAGAFPCALGTLQPAETRTITSTFNVPADYTGPDPIVNTATVTTTGGDTNPANDTASLPTAIVRVAGFFTLPPCRILDTRGAAGVPLGAPPLVAGAVRHLPVRRSCGLPDNAKAVSFNVTVTGSTAAGDLRIFPGGGGAPLASVINYLSGQTRANNGMVPLGSDGSIDVQCDQGSGLVHMIMDVNGYFTANADAPTPAGMKVEVRPAPEVELTFDQVTNPGVTTAQVLDFGDNRPGAVDQSLKAFFPSGSPEQALVPDVMVPSYLTPLGKGGPGGLPTFVLTLVDTTATFSRTAEFHGQEDFRLGWDPPCVSTADPTQEPRTFYAREPLKGEPALVEEALFAGQPAFVDISSGCGSNKGAGWNFSLFLTARDTRTPAQIAQFMLDRMLDVLTQLAGFITSPTVATNLTNDVQSARTNLGPAPALAMANMADFIGIVDGNPGAFSNTSRNVAGELAARAQSATYMIRKLVPPGTFAEFTVPTAGTGPLGIVQGADGNLYFAAGDFGTRIGRVTRAGVITEFPLPGGSTRPYAMTLGPDGNVWFTEATKIGRITPAGTITEFPVAGLAGFFGITTGPDGNLWFTQFNTGKIARMTTAGVITEFPILPAGAGPNGIVTGPDGNLWFTEYRANRIGTMTTDRTLVAEYALPAGSTPEGIAVGPDGNLWFAERAGRIGRITTTGVITEFTIPTAGAVASWITSGPDGNLWFTEFTGNKIGRITPSGTITEFTVPTAGGAPYDIAVGPDGNLWFTEQGGNKIGRITP